MRVNLCKSVATLIPSNAQRIGDAVYVVEPRRDERDLKYSLVIETYGSESLVIGG